MSALRKSMEAVAAATGAAAVGAIVWMWHSLSVKGVLGPRGSSGMEMLGRRIALAQATTHYAIFSDHGAWGKGKLEPDSKFLVVYVHGLGAQLEQLTWGEDGGLARALVNAGYTLLALDLYGHGFSDAPDTRLAPGEFVEQLQALLDHLEVRNPFDLIGFSHGSFIASAYAASKPGKIKHLVLTSPFGCDLPGHSSIVVSAFAALIVHLCFEGNMCQIRTVFRILLNMEGHHLPEILHAIDADPMQTLIVAGDQDCDPAMGILQNARRIHDLLPRSKLHVIPGGSHMTWATGSPAEQRQYRDLVVQFLAEQVARL